MSGMSNYAQIPTNLICRFGELTKTEIVVVSYLYASRNRKTGQCNPSRSAIARAVSIDRAHVSPAVKSLEDKEWICEMPDGNFLLTEPPENVAKSAQVKRAKTAQGGVRNQQQDCAKSATDPCEIRNTHIKESFEQRNEQKKEQRERPVTFSHPVLVAFRTVTNRNPPKECWNLLANKIGVDVDVGKLGVVYAEWVAKGHNPRNYDGIADWYLGNRKNGKKSNGSNSDDSESVRQAGDRLRANAKNIIA